MNPQEQQKIVNGHGHLISSFNPMSRAISKHGSSIEDSGPPSPTEGVVLNFAEVAPGIYRSSFPRAGNFEHLRSLGLKTILTLIPEEYPTENVTFMKENGIQHFQVPIPAHKNALVVIPPPSIAEALKILLDPSQHPVLIHCNKGKHRTGCIVACYRKIHQWTVGAILTEYRHYAGDKFRALDESFIELFDPEAASAMVYATQQSPTLLPSCSLLPTPPGSIKNG